VDSPRKTRSERLEAEAERVKGQGDGDNDVLWVSIEQIDALVGVLGRLPSVRMVLYNFCPPSSCW
jgi:hypothetical protein